MSWFQIYKKIVLAILLFGLVALPANAAKRKKPREARSFSNSDCSVYASQWRALSTKPGYRDALRGPEFTRDGRRIRKPVNTRYMWRAHPDEPIEFIEIRLRPQKILVYQNGRTVGEGPVSSGREGYETITGKFKVLQKEKDHKSNLYGSFVRGGKIVDYNAEVGQTPPPGCRYEPAPMPHFLRLTNCGIGMHAGFLPGYAASHGCIRLPAGLAEKLFAAVRLGTPVEILP